MEFFHASDLEYFSSVIGKKFQRGDQAFDEIGRKLKDDGVFAKTAFWAKLIGEEGYVAETSFYWQISGIIRKYTWGRIYIPGTENRQVFFTVGVGSRLTQDRKTVTTLEYKLDCRRDKLSQYQIKNFDKYLYDQLGEYPWRTINVSNLENYDWSKLKNETLDFIEEHSEYYEDCINIIWPNGVGVTPKIARICWNKYQWKKPSGPDGKSTSTADSFEKEKGHGYEEWLLDTDKQLDGYHYGFIQAFNKGKHEGKAYDVQLYSLFNDIESKENRFYWIAHIPTLEVLTIEQMDYALNKYKQNGWYDEMLGQLKDIRVDQFNFDPIPEEYIFNVRFKVQSGHYTIYDPPVEIEYPNAEIGGNRHYVLLDKPAGSSIDIARIGKYRFKEGHNPTKKGRTSAIYKGRTGQKLLLHEEIKENIFNQLNTEYLGTPIKVGTENPTGFGKQIDLVISDPEKGDTFYEIKTASSALACIREAMGQIIEYCYYPDSQNAKRLVIVSPNKLSASDELYISHIRHSLGIELYYQRYSIQNEVLEEKIL
ncbi:MAG: hypothetical protein ABJH44_05615 [Balneola sp.]